LPESVAEGIKAVVNEAQRQFPKSRIILFGVLPAGKEKNSKIRKKCEKIHQILSKMKRKRIKYVNPTAWFVESNGMIKDGLYRNDYIHLTSEGYNVWASEIEQLIKE